MFQTRTHRILIAAWVIILTITHHGAYAQTGDSLPKYPEKQLKEWQISHDCFDLGFDVRSCEEGVSSIDSILNTRDYNAIEFLYQIFQEKLMASKRSNCQAGNTYKKESLAFELPKEKYPDWKNFCIKTADFQKATKQIETALFSLNNKMDQASIHITVNGYDGQPIPTKEVTLEFIGIGPDAPIVRWRGVPVSNSFVTRADLRVPPRGSLNIYIQQKKWFRGAVFRGSCGYNITDSMANFIGNQETHQEEVVARNEQDVRLKVRAKIALDPSLIFGEEAKKEVNPEIELTALPLLVIASPIAAGIKAISDQSATQASPLEAEVEVDYEEQQRSSKTRKYIAKLGTTTITIKQIGLPGLVELDTLNSRRNRHHCDASCQMTGGNDPKCTGYIEGEGKGTTQAEACLAAQKAANANMREWNQARGLSCQKRHCNCNCSQR